MTLLERQGLGDLNQKGKKNLTKEKREETDTRLPSVWVQTVLCLYQKYVFPLCSLIGVRV